jgi:hypothetical protein
MLFRVAANVLFLQAVVVKPLPSHNKYKLILENSKNLRNGTEQVITCKHCACCATTISINLIILFETNFYNQLIINAMQNMFFLNFYLIFNVTSYATATIVNCCFSLFD